MQSKIFFTGERYNYWMCKVEGQSCNVEMSMDPQEIEKDIEGIEEKLNKINTDLENLKKEKKDSKDSAKLTAIQNKILTAESQYRTEYTKGRKLEELYNYCERYIRIKYRIARLKDVYSREETMCIHILNDGKEDGIIVTSISKLDADIAKLERFGIFLSASYLVDELVKIIRDNYFDIAVTERTYIGNDVPENVVVEFVSMCRDRIMEDEGDKGDKGNKENKENNYLSDDKCFYDVRCTEINAWYKESPYQRYTLREIKEAMVIYEFMAKPTKGRLDNTINGQKVIRFIKDKMDSMDNGEENKNE